MEKLKWGDDFEAFRKLTNSTCEGGTPVSQNHIKFGGVGFNAKVSPSKINRFVSNLPETKRQSLFQVAEELKSAGMIETTGDITKQHNKNLYNTESR